MSRLPIPNGDNDVWGNILNDFLSVAHNSDGTLINVASDTSVVHNTTDETIAGVKTFTASPVVPTPLNANQAANKAYVDSMAGSGGSSTLAGDSDVTITTPSNGQVLTYNVATTKWENKTPTSAPVTSVNGQTGAVTLTKSDVGLANVDNTSDLNKPISTATQSALNAKANTSSLATVATSGSYTDLTNKPTIPAAQVNSDWNAVSGVAQILNKPTIPTITDATTSSKGIVQLAGDLAGTAAAPTVPGLAGKEGVITAGTVGQYWRGDKTWQTLDKTAVGLSNVDNTSDLNKPISTATQSALNAKAPLASPTFTGTVTVPAPATPTDAATKSYVDSQVSSSTAPDATTSSKGIVQLAGDLGGTAAAPTVKSVSLTTALPITQGGTGAGTAPGALNNLLPTQTGNGGKFLQTDGTNASWAASATDQDIYALTWMEVGS